MVKSTDEIFEDVKEIIENSVGIPQNEIKLDSTLFDELEVDSIDLVDILFELETLYDIELKISDLESKAREELDDAPYEIDGVITPEGLTALKKHMTEVDHDKLIEGITVHQVVKLFTVESLCKLVQHRLEMNDEK